MNLLDDGLGRYCDAIRRDQRRQIPCPTAAPDEPKGDCHRLLFFPGNALKQWSRTSLRAQRYSATKSAVDAVTRVLAKELGSRRIRVNSINPAGIETEGTHLLGIMGDDFKKQLVAQTPLGRVGQPEDIASIAVFLASPESGWLTGETLTASGGYR